MLGVRGGRPPVDVDTVITMTWDGKSAAQIAAVLGVNPKSVSRVRVRARNAGIPLPPPDHVRPDSDRRAGRGRAHAATPHPGTAAATARGARGKVGRTDVDTVIRMTRGEATAREIADVLGVHPDTVSRVRARARAAGVPLPPPDCRSADRRTGRRRVPSPSDPEPAPRASAAPDWRHRALCRDEDPELFFPAGTTGPAERQVEEAKAVCRRCPVTGDCLAWALDTGVDYGVWGGTAEDERRLLKKEQMRARVRTA